MYIFKPCSKAIKKIKVHAVQLRQNLECGGVEI
jgi:hypothetical protein